MKYNNRQIFKGLFIVGIILLFISLFLDWYTFEVYNTNKDLIASWNYHHFTGWTTPLLDAFTYNDLFRPHNLDISPILHFLFMFIIISCAFTTLTKDVEKVSSPQKLKNYAYLNLFLLLLVGFYIIIFPIGYLLPNELYFPFNMVEDHDANLFYVYSLDIGYYSQVIGFVLAFPYSIFYYQTITHFERKDQTVEKVIGKYIQEIQEPLDMDKFIAEEVLKQRIKGELPPKVVERNSSNIVKKRVK